MAALGILASLLFPLSAMGFIFSILKWRRERTLCHHHSKSHVQVRHHREICTCEEAEKWGEEAREIWGDVLKDHPKLSRASNVLYLRPIKESGVLGHFSLLEGIVVDPKGRGKDEVRGTIAHELHHRIRSLRFGWRFYVETLLEIPARRRFAREAYDGMYYLYYPSFSSEMAALVFSAHYSRTAAELLRTVHRIVAIDPGVREEVARLRGKRRRKR